MFCIKCGNELASGAVFCNVCGANQNGDNTSNIHTQPSKIGYETNSESERDLLLQELQSSEPVMKQIAQKEKEIDSLQKENAIKIKQLSQKMGTALAFACLFLFFGIGVVTADIEKDMGNVIASLITVPIGVFLAYIGFKNFSKKNKLIQESKIKVSEIQQDISKLEKDDSLKWLPSQYVNTRAYNAIYAYTLTKRANNLQEALNLFETEEHQARLEMIAASGNNNY